MHFIKKTMEELQRKDSLLQIKAQHFPIKIILDDVRSMNNVGSVFRTADSFNVEEIILCGLTPTPPHRDIQKTALGATESVNWQYNTSITDTINNLKNQQYTIVALEQTSNSIALQTHSYSKESKIALIFGNEVNGVSDQALALCDAVIEIPQFGAKHSLNIAVSAGIAIWELSKLHI